MDDHGKPISYAAIGLTKAADAVVFGAVGVAKHDNNPFHLKPEQGLLRLRKELDLFANLRPAMVFPALTEASTLKTELVEGLPPRSAENRNPCGHTVSRPPPVLVDDPSPRGGRS